MKDIKSFDAPKYGGSAYELAEDGIYKTEDNGESIYNDKTIYVTTLSFVQEPEFGEGTNAAEISQYPLEALLDDFLCYVSDFYPELNTTDSQVCYQEFASPDIEDVRKLRSIIGKHVYEQGGRLYIE
ncbi:MAG: hypothetical protein K2J80_11760 [Oscillospiraceae bacterium]|nr:hypothetical protein [Oscillospiraceae bacterium]